MHVTFEEKPQLKIISFYSLDKALKGTMIESDMPLYKWRVTINKVNSPIKLYLVQPDRFC